MAQWQSKSVIGANLYAATDDPEFTPGTIVQGEDTGASGLGSAEFMYVQADEAIDATEVVIVDQLDMNASLAVANGVGPVGVALADLADTKYGWVQISGVAECKVATGFSAGAKPAYLTSTAGTIDDAVVVGDTIFGSRCLSAINTPSTGTAYVGLTRSFTTNESN